MRKAIIGVVMLTTVLVASAGNAARAAGDSYTSQFGWGMGAIGANLLYMPTKLAYTAVGGIVGGLSYAVSLGSVDLDAVWSPVLGGTYVLSPAMLRGEEPILFFGETYHEE